MKKFNLSYYSIIAVWVLCLISLPATAQDCQSCIGSQMEESSSGVIPDYSEYGNV
ncbi:MAG: hypothetical protein H8E87_08100 [FCB group bacterium]|nr:hypothetical protein [FCB group bacterium]